MRIVPPSVAKRYVQVDDKFYFQDKTLAFVDKGDKLATSSQNTDVVRTLVAIVKAREWDSITVGERKSFAVPCGWRDPLMASKSRDTNPAT